MGLARGLYRPPPTRSIASPVAQVATSDCVPLRGGTFLGPVGAPHAPGLCPPPPTHKLLPGAALQDFRTWLIEINGQPACAEALLPAFTRDTAELVIHPVFGDAGVRPRRHNFERIDPSFGDDFDLEDNPVLPRRSAKAPGGRGRVYAAQ